MKQYLRWSLVPLFAVIGALVFVNLFASVGFSLQALQANLSIKSSLKGYTVLRVPPVGIVKAETHKFPVSIEFSLENIDLDLLKELLVEGTEQDELVNETKVVVTAALKKFILVTLSLSFGGGVFGLVILQRRKIKELLLGGLIGLTVVSVLLFGTYRTFDMQKFQAPEYEGIIKAAPWMIELVQDSFSTVKVWGQQMRSIAENLSELFRRVEVLQTVSPGDGQIKVLHVSDIHNNPVSFEFIDQVVKTFGINMVIDTGDLTDLGTPLEASFLQRIKELKVTYVVVPGNHETPSVIAELKKTPNVVVLEGSVQEIAGLNIAGVGDPSSMKNISLSPEQTEINDYAEKLRAIIDNSEAKPDVVAAHNPRIAGQFIGYVPVVLTGHTHQYNITDAGNSIMINAGTSGAAGVGALETKKEIPYTFVLMHFDRTEKGVVLKYTDTIKISNLQSGYSLERKVYPELYGAEPGNVYSW